MVVFKNRTPLSTDAYIISRLAVCTSFKLFPVVSNGLYDVMLRSNFIYPRGKLFYPGGKWNWNLLELIGINWNLLEPIGTYWN